MSAGRLEAYVEPTLSELMAEAEKRLLAERQRHAALRAAFNHPEANRSARRIKALDTFITVAGELIR